MSDLPLSVIVAATQPWPEIRPCLDSLHDQARALGAEVIVADGCGRALSEDALAAYPEVRWLPAPGTSVFYLRALAASAARGEIVAVTEDHCRVASDWCERTVAAHRQFPHAAAVGGAVENGATERLADWASFFIVNGAALAPLGTGERSKISMQANVSYKRHVIPPGVPSLGRMEWMFNEALRRQGETLVIDDRIVVHHVQSLGFLATCHIHFDDGRSIAAFRLHDISWGERAARLLACAIMPPAVLLRTSLAVLRTRRFLGTFAASLPMTALLVCCRAAGAFTGFLGGAGTSPLRIR